MIDDIILFPPSALDSTTPSGEDTQLITGLTYSPPGTENMDVGGLSWNDGYTVRWIPVVDVELTADGLTCRVDDSPSTIVVRPIGPYDYPNRNGPLPVEAILASLQEPEDMDPILAMVDENGYVASLLLMSGSQMWLRFGGAWQLVPTGGEEDPIDGWNVVEVDDNAIGLFDSFDLKGELASVTGYPAIDKADLEPYIADAIIEADALAEEVGDLTAAATQLLDYVMPDMISPITSAADLDDAIVRANDDPSIRWYVEKRAKALGYETDLPWC